MFSPQEIENVKNSKYNGTDDSILAKLFLRRFWDWAIHLVPLGVAPNLITFMGFLIGLSSCILSFALTNGLTKPLGSWVCFWNAISLFIYHTLDNLDGRQARRTSFASPLGQFFDHGCDAIIGVTEVIKMAATLGLGASSVTFYFVFLTAIAFFLTAFEEYVTGRFYLGPINGATEGVVILMAVHVVVGLAPGTRGLFKKVPVYVVFCAGFALTVVGSFINMVRLSIGDRTKQKRIAIGLLAPVLSVALTAANIVHNPEVVDSLSFIVAGGFVPQYQAQLCIVAHLVLREPWRLFTEPMLVVIWVLEAIPIFLDSNGFIFYWPFVASIVVIVISVFDINTISALSTALEIPVFSIRRPEPADTIQIEIDNEDDGTKDEREKEGAPLLPDSE
jgi:phosphatidylglycerophosphate synthase